MPLTLDSGGPDSPLLETYRRLAPEDTWDQTQDYGWVGQPPGYRDRGTFAILERDFTFSSGEPTVLRLTVPPGPHQVYILTGDSTSLSGNTIVSIDGQVIAESGDREIPEGQFEWFDFALDGGQAGTTTDVQLTGDLRAGNWRLNGLVMLSTP